MCSSIDRVWKVVSKKAIFLVLGSCLRVVWTRDRAGALCLWGLMEINDKVFVFSYQDSKLSIENLLCTLKAKEIIRKLSK